MSIEKIAIQELDTVKTLRDHGYEVCEEVLSNSDLMCLKTPKTVLRDIKTKTILYEDEHEYKVVAKGLAYALTQTRIDTLKEVEEWVEKKRIEPKHKECWDGIHEPCDSCISFQIRDNLAEDILTHIQSLLDKKE